MKKKAVKRKAKALTAAELKKISAGVEAARKVGGVFREGRVDDVFVRPDPDANYWR